MKESDVRDKRKYVATDVESSRGNEMGALIVDIAKRDQENDTYSINIMIFLRHDVKRGEVEPAIRRACGELFGPRDPEHVDAVFYNQNEIKKRLGRPIQDHDNFEVTIQHPLSVLYSVDKVKRLFLPTLNKHL